MPDLLVTQYVLPNPADPMNVLAVTVDLVEPMKNKWAIQYASCRWTRKGEWEYRPIPSSRTAAFKKRTWFTLEEAQKIVQGFVYCGNAYPEWRAPDA